MATSQFSIYTSSDVNGPGPMHGWSGSLIQVLDYCLTSGSVSKSSAGWSKPIANSASLDGITPAYACYRPPSGSRMTLFVNDYFPNATAAGKEAWLTGWETISSLCGAAVTANVGVGTGQFPTPAQQLTTGHVVCRKSSVSDNSTDHYWVAFADAYTFYLFIQNGDSAEYYACITFGDVFSFGGSADAYRCLLIGWGTENAVGAWSQPYAAGSVIGYDNFACSMGYFLSQGSATGYNAYLPYPLVGHYMARTSGGGGASIAVGKTFDFSKQTTNGNVNGGSPYGAIAMGGNIQTPNSADNSLYLSPVTIHEPSSYGLRGRMRGFWQVAHPVANFSDGQTFAGGGDYAGKSFMIIKTDITGGFFAMETSNTVETN